MSRELLQERYEKEFEKLPDFIQKYLLYLEAIPVQRIPCTNTLKNIEDSSPGFLLNKLFRWMIFQRFN